MTTISKHISSIHPKYWLFFLIILALGLRVFNLDQYGLWYDEAISYKAAQLDIRSILTNQIQSSHPPLYYLILHYWLYIFPNSDFSARMLSVIWNIALIPVVYFLSKELFKNNKVAICSSILVVISPFHIAYSQELRMYTQLMLLTTLGILTYIYAINQESYKYWFFFIIVFFFAIYTHYFASIILIGIFFYDLLKNKLNKLSIPLIISCTILFILYIPWFIIILTQPELSEGSLRPLFAGDSIQAKNILMPIINLTILIFGKIHYILFVISLYVILLFFCVFALHIYKNRLNINEYNIFLFFIIATLIIIPSFLYYSFSMFFPHRSIAAASPLILILMASALECKKKILTNLIIATILLSFIGTIYYYNTYNNAKPPNIKVAQFINDNYKSNDIILHTDDFSYIPLLRYLNFSDHALLAGNPRQLRPDSSYESIGGQLWNIDQFQNMSGRLWLIVVGLWGRDWQMEQRDYLVQHYSLIDEYYISGYVVYLLDLDGS
jgi:mannosyltransferase